MGFLHYSRDSEDFARDYQALLRCVKRPTTEQLYERVLDRYPKKSIVVDFGAGSGTLTKELVERYETVHAVETNAELREILIRDCPTANTIDATITSFDMEGEFDIGIMRHSLYFVPDHRWPGTVAAVASHLSEFGVLLVTLLHPEQPIFGVMEALGAPRIDAFQLISALRLFPEFRVEQVATYETIESESFQDVCAVARYTLNHRGREDYGRPVDDYTFERFVEQFLWDARRKEASWPYPSISLLIRRNDYWKSADPSRRA
ncbi:Trans-aconitate 2-methyltransferase [Planctomycetes bacterium Pan216]|uniref:Trans-aconitate 2-methyltransferase n=1 Tax=Kolteria novifilia TaxID=2527975 RepID=A0A518B432_9BACT|nr:Trans-aconitate 2-methyltransferase [Planctomycetes bacterium Pan216]